VSELAVNIGDNSPFKGWHSVHICRLLCLLLHLDELCRTLLTWVEVGIQSISTSGYIYYSCMLLLPTYNFNKIQLQVMCILKS
jgi:hypothetical protein